MREVEKEVGGVRSWFIENAVWGEVAVYCEEEEEEEEEEGLDDDGDVKVVMGGGACSILSARAFLLFGMNSSCSMDDRLFPCTMEVWVKEKEGKRKKKEIEKR